MSSSYHSAITRNSIGNQLPTLSASNNGVPYAEVQAPTVAADATSMKDAAAADADPELLEQQLQLIQLCFAEHEFGIVVDEKGEEVGGSSSSSSSDRSSSESTQEESGSGSGAVPFSSPAARRGRRSHRYSAYDPLSFVRGKVQHGVPLTVLSQDLHSYAQYLEDKIAECVNTDVHTAFVNVSSHLVGMRDELSYMERPLAVAMEKLSGAVAQLSTTSLGVKNEVEAACAAEMERYFDAVYLKGVVVYETIAYQLDDLAQLLQITVDATPSRSPAIAATKGTTANGSSRNLSSAAHEATSKGSSLRKETFTIAAGTQLSDAALDILEDVVLLFQELKEVCQRLVSLASRQQEKADMADYVAAAERSVMGVLEVVLGHVSRMTFGVLAAADAKTGVKSTNSPEVEDAAPSPAARQLLGRVIELYGQAGEREQFSAVFRNAVLRPPLEAVVSWKAATQARQSAEGTVALLEQMKTVLRTKFLPLLPLLRESYGAPLHPVATIVWPILSETLVKKLPSLYEVGIPNHFQIKYKAAYSVLAMAEAACADLAELAVLRQSPDVVLWNHKWNLDVYAALRVSEVDKALQSVASPLDRLPPSTEGGYHLRLFYIVQHQLLHLFSPAVYLYLCTPRFLRQTVACCYRVLQRVQEAIARSPAVAVANTANQTEDNGSKSSNASPVDGATPATDAAAAAAASAASETLLLAIADAHVLRSFLTGELLPLILERLCGETGEAAAAAATQNSSALPTSERTATALVTDVIDFASRTVCGQFVQHARATLVRQVTDDSTGPLQNVKSVRSAYSHTRKTMPSAASWYVAPVLQPLRHFMEEAERCGFAGAALEETVAEILRVIVKQFVVLAKDTLITAKKTEESWEKLRRRKEGTAASPVAGESGAAEAAAGEGPATAVAPGQRVTVETATDRDKMTIQLWMDARALWQAVQQPPLNVAEAAAATAFAPAFELLRRAEWIQGADVPEPPDVDA
ncbi:hypothetical protein ABB37_04042 [Leptomonas pyrrhocoris]|uniref:Conserved oligomeric Golgi complex subunit 2 n=1 Tax=Leptomonas pyrrhocoris TaxID=157538 RepID=A0A0M9G3Y4_LEPPY|nr:hypothetical protein ABB37_04042 [Leptomonas pyrrhocoris]KPA81753.1 hypothetical protein ABB37_04042 [Leptomonas pyrrhocoris]|eukprot:XP_015660192.1 hypothetical protein ABB37_04042 [Leptomonas pyrrhocoris]